MIGGGIRDSEPGNQGSEGRGTARLREVLAADRSDAKPEADLPYGIAPRSGQPLSFDKLMALDNHLASLSARGGTPDIQEQIADLNSSFDLGQLGRLSPESL